MAKKHNPDEPLSDERLNQLRKQASYGDREAVLELHVLHGTPPPDWAATEIQLRLPLPTQPT